MAIPKECKMPDLTYLDSLMSRLIIQALIGDPGISPKAALYRRNFIRLIDKALKEYHRSREAILAQIQETKRPANEMIKNGRQIFIFQFTDHTENCINAISRLFKLLDRIKSEREVPALPRKLRKLVETINKPVDDVRNAIEHIDKKIRNDETGPGRPIMLAINENDDGVVIVNYEIKFEELAMILGKMHEVAQYILGIKKMDTE